MTLQGSLLKLPIQADRRGTMATISDRAAIVAQSIASIVETRQGERVMLPDYGIPDFVFSIMDAGFTARLAFFLQQQILRYEPLVDSVTVTAGTVVGGLFTGGLAADQQSAAVNISYTVRGSNTPLNLVYPTWQLAAGA